MKINGGIFVVPVEINGAVTLEFAVDSGATYVAVPADVFSTLKRTGIIKDSDIVGQSTYTLAGGSKSQSATFTIRSLSVGNTVVENVKASVMPSQGSLLLGVNRNITVNENKNINRTVNQTANIGRNVNINRNMPLGMHSPPGSRSTVVRTRSFGVSNGHH